MSDRFDRFPTNLDSPASDAFSITPSDANDLAISTRYIYVGGTGDLKVDTVDGTTVTFTAATTGSILPVRIKKVYATGTTATNLVGLI